MKFINTDTQEIIELVVTDERRGSLYKEHFNEAVKEANLKSCGDSFYEVEPKDFGKWSKIVSDYNELDTITHRVRLHGDGDKIDSLEDFEGRYCNETYDANHFVDHAQELLESIRHSTILHNL